MSFSQVYRNFFDLISVFGNAPISRDENGLFKRSIKKTFYSAILGLAIGVYFTVIITQQLILNFQDHETNGFTLLFIVTVREVASCIMFGYIMFMSIVVAGDHAVLLNVLVDLEREIKSYLERFDFNENSANKRRFSLESNWTAAGLILWQLGINASIVLIFNDFNMTIRLVWMSTLHFSIVMYIRMLIVVLGRNLRLMRLCFGHNYSSLLATDLKIVDAVASAKNKLVEVFSGILLINLFYDFITKLVTLFWWIYSIVNGATYQFTFDAFYVLAGYVMPFWIKLYLLTHATEGLASEVS